MNIAIIPEGPIGFDGESYTNSEGEGWYIDSLAKYFDIIEIYAYAFHKSDAGFSTTSYYNFKSSNIKIFELPLYRNSNARFLRKILQLTKVTLVFLRNMRKWDLMYLFIPGYPSAIAYLLNQILFKKPYIVYAASDWSKEESALIYHWKGIWGRIFFSVYHRVNLIIEKQIIKNANFVLVAGRKAYERYKKWQFAVFETVPRLNWNAIQIYHREDTCIKKPTVLLYVGYLYARKGINFLIESLSILIKKGFGDVILKIAGDGEQRDYLEKLSFDLGIKENIHFLGYLPNGPLLFKEYEDADIFVFPSLGEGFPRVLYEAMSQSLPIVTTNVGGIPYKMKHEENALLVPPMDPKAIADAVERIMSDGNLRRNLIRNGREFMQELIEKNDGGKQFYSLVKEHCIAYTPKQKAVRGG